ncbi:hypothetical protein GCM10026987_03860 [Belliella aquatica]|uniref:Uncharacterized protein n=1 Tax=Belliella aquatica TaxID=1323734 RepID=A0ABQ1M968_9BACT|nr:hypothetical protein GCM10010993_14800 [Belliella aquatica]
MKKGNTNNETYRKLVLKIVNVFSLSFFILENEGKRTAKITEIIVFDIVFAKSTPLVKNPKSFELYSFPINKPLEFLTKTSIKEDANKLPPNLYKFFSESKEKTKEGNQFD